MWLYETMELPDIKDDTMNNWKPGPRSKGLNLPILLKVILFCCNICIRGTDYLR